MFLNNNVCSKTQTTIDIATKVYFSLFIQRMISKIIIDVKNVKNNPINEYLVILLIKITISSAFSLTSSFPFLPNTMETTITINLEKLDRNNKANNSKHGIRTKRKYGFASSKKR